MAPTHSQSLKKLSALLFEEQEEDAASDAEAEEGPCFGTPLGDDLPECRFERAVSEDTTVPGQPLSRSISPEGSDDELERPAAAGRLESFPQAAGLFRGRLADPGEEVDHSQELIAVGPNGVAHFVPEDELPELQALRFLLEEEASPLFLVGRDGKAFLAPDGENVDWERLDAVREAARNETVVSPVPSLASDDGRRPQFARPLCPAARPLKPLQLEAEKLEEQPPKCFRERRPEGSVPRSPSLKRLSSLLFAASGGTAPRGAAACEEPEELELEAPRARAAAAVPEAVVRDYVDDAWNRWVVGYHLLYGQTWAGWTPSPFGGPAGICALQ